MLYLQEKARGDIMITICVDCMGSDNGAKATVGGIINFLKKNIVNKEKQ